MNSTGMSSVVPTIKCEDTSLSPGAPIGSDGEPVSSGAYNLSVNVNLSSAVMNLLAAENAAGTATLRTPEIVNDVITMTNPLDQYSYNKRDKGGSGNDSSSSLSNGSSATSPASATPPSIQKTCSELIKAGLKLSIESKRKMSGSDTDGGSIKRLKKEDSDDDYDSSHTQSTKTEGLTPEDEERRRRRRERNKIAATKCRMKKRERTVNLVTESEVLENQNIDLKTQLKDLEVQKRQLIDMLALHAASCVKNNSAARMSPTTPYNMIRPYESPNAFPATYEAHSPYLRPESANVLASSYTCITPLNGDSSIDTISSLETSYINPNLIDSEYPRSDSVLELPSNAEVSFISTDSYLPKANLLIPIENPEQEYYDSEINYNLSTTQQCHTYPTNVPDSQNKLNNALNDRCLV